MDSPAIMSGMDQEAQKDIFVGDGSVDLRGNRSIRAKTGTWKASPFIYGILIGDTLCVLGIVGNLIFYLLGNQHLTLTEAANTISYFTGTTYLLPLFWGFIADSYIGRYWILAFSSVVTTVGLLVLTLSAARPAFQPAIKCVPSAENGEFCARASSYVLSWMYAGLYLIAVGSAGMKPTLTALGQDQFEQTNAKEKKTGEHFFTGYFVVLNASSVFNVTFLFYIQDRFGYGWGYGLVTGIVFLASCFFLLGTPYYRHVKPSGSPLTRIAQVLVVAVKNSRNPVPSADEELYELSDKHYMNQAIRKLARTDRLRFLDKAAIPPPDRTAQQSGPWELCTVTQVESLKSVVQLLPVWLTTVSIYIMFSQMISFSGQQAQVMNRKIGNLNVPPGSSAIFLISGALVFIPIYEFLIVPFVRRRTGEPHGLTSLQRIGLGMLMAVLAMTSAALVENRKVGVVRDNKLTFGEILLKQDIPMSFAWLIPQYALLGAVEFLVAVGQLSFFYAECPDNMRTVATALFFSSVSVGYFLSTALVDSVNKYSGGWLKEQVYTGGLRNYYWLLTVTLVINLLAFLAAAHWYTYKKLDETSEEKEDDAL